MTEICEKRERIERREMTERDARGEVIRDIRTIFGCNSDAQLKRKFLPFRRHVLREMNGKRKILLAHKKSGYDGILYQGRGGIYYYGEDGRLARLMEMDVHPEITIAVCTWNSKEKIMYAYDVPLLRGDSIEISYSLSS
jgi:hypothetical protein